MAVRWIILLALIFTNASAAEFVGVRQVEIIGYSGEAMEPFVSRDGRYLLFNDSNEPGKNTDLHWAERITSLVFRYGGRIEGANSAALDGVPSLDNQGNLYFVSLRSYRQTLGSIYRSQFRDGHAAKPELVQGLSLGKPGQINFDIEISADGATLYGVDGAFSGGPAPNRAQLFVAHRVGNRFERAANSNEIMAQVNREALQYAPAISSDGLDLYFTRATGSLWWRRLTIEHARRDSVLKPFGRSETLRSVVGVVEAPSLSNDGRELYFHNRTPDGFRVFQVSKQ